jgi:hypothetical protein
MFSTTTTLTQTTRTPASAPREKRKPPGLDSSQSAHARGPQSTRAAPPLLVSQAWDTGRGYRDAMGENLPLSPTRGGGRGPEGSETQLH